MELLRVLRPLEARLKGLVGRARLSGFGLQGGAQTAAARLAGGETRAVARFGPWGLASVPPDGTEAVILFEGGDRASGIAVAEAGRDRPAGLGPGEIALYNASGIVLRLKADGSLVVSGAAKVRLETARLEVTGVVVERAP